MGLSYVRLKLYFLAIGVFMVKFFIFNKPILISFSDRVICYPLLLTETSILGYFRVVLPHLTRYHQVLLNAKKSPLRVYKSTFKTPSFLSKLERGIEIDLSC